MKIELDTDKMVEVVGNVSGNVFSLSKYVVVKGFKIGKKLNNCVKAVVVEFKKEEGESEC